jgi:hypothetical protein
LIAACCAALLIFAKAVGGRVEGALFPVVSDVRLVLTPARSGMAVPLAGAAATRVTGRAVKRRACRLERLDWRLGHPGAWAAGHYGRAEVVHAPGGLDAARRGAIRLGPLEVALTPAQVRGRFHAVAFHRCHPLWLTETVLFAPPG